MERTEDTGFRVYKGLQKPLVFRSLKGRYIYWGLSFVLAGFLASVLLSVAVSFPVGLLALLGIAFGGLGYTAHRQRQGLHPKKRSSGVYLLPARWRHGAPKEIS